MEPFLFHLVPIASVTWHHWKEPDSNLHAPSLQVFMSAYKTSPQPCLVPTENSQLSVFPHRRDASVPAGNNPPNAALDTINLLCHKDVLLTHSGMWHITCLFDGELNYSENSESVICIQLFKKYHQLALILLAFWVEACLLKKTELNVSTALLSLPHSFFSCVFKLNTSNKTSRLCDWEIMHHIHHFMSVFSALVIYACHLKL